MAERPKSVPRGKGTKKGKPKNGGGARYAVSPALSYRRVRPGFHRQVLALWQALQKTKKAVWSYAESLQGRQTFEFSLAEMHCPNSSGSSASFRAIDSSTSAVTFAVRLLALGVGGGLTSTFQLARDFAIYDGACHSISGSFDAEIYQYALEVLGRTRKHGLRIKPIRLHPSLKCDRVVHSRNQPLQRDPTCEIPASVVRAEFRRIPTTIDMRTSDISTTSTTSFEWASSKRVQSAVTIPLPWGEIGYRLSVSVTRGMAYDYECKGGRFYAWYEGRLPNFGYLWTTRP